MFKLDQNNTNDEADTALSQLQKESEMILKSTEAGIAKFNASVDNFKDEFLRRIREGVKEEKNV